MNKLSKLMMGLAALSFAACSSDEPAPTPAPGDGEGTTMYLNVNITDANSARSRAAGYDEDGKPKDPAEQGDYVFGDGTEHAVNKADFFFFDEDGRYVTRANVWKAATGTDAPNIEYMGANTLVLRNLTKDNLPVYVVTVLNAPADFAETVETNNYSMEQLAKQPFAIKTGSNFVMSTTSFYDAEDTERYDNEHYYATKLKTTDFMTEVPSAADVKANAVKIYVERLAAKFEITGLTPDGVFPVDVTIAGKPNGENGSIADPSDDPNVEDGEIPSASTKLYVKILGYGLTGQETTSNLSKNIEDFTTTLNAATTPWATWNHPEFYRSYWGKSVNYGKEAPALSYTKFEDAQNAVNTAIYGYETTNSLNNLRDNATNKNLKTDLVTNFIFTAQVFSDADCNNPVDLVEFDGVYFTLDQYKKYVLGKLLAGNKLQYWKDEESKTTMGEDENGKPVEITTYTYKPLSIEDFTCDWTSDETSTANGAIVIEYKPADGVIIYKNGEGWKEGQQKTVASAADVNAELANFNEQTPATGFKNGSMYYNVPIEHLNTTTENANQSKNYKIDAEGQYGVVRNHWYQLKVNKVITLGHGVFKPTGDNAEELKPQPTTDKFALAAQINILSWKIVQQSVDL